MGDEGNMCGSVACDGGMRGACPGGETEGAFRKVKCAQVHHTPCVTLFLDGVWCT